MKSKHKLCDFMAYCHNGWNNKYTIHKAYIRQYLLCRIAFNFFFMNNLSINIKKVSNVLKFVFLNAFQKLFYINDIMKIKMLRHTKYFCIKIFGFLAVTLV